MRNALSAAGSPLLYRAIAALIAIAMAAVLWLPCLHFIYRPDLSDFLRDGVPSPRARELAARQLALWSDPSVRAVEIGRMRATCQEWDFMGRTFLVLAFANMALREPAETRQYLDAIDAIIDETVLIEQDKGFTFFLMDYGKDKSWFRQKPPRSIFVDGEIALMMGARRLVEEKPSYREPMLGRIAIMAERMSQNPVMCAESYPDECWMFCNAVALAAMKMSDVLDGTDHSELFGRWLETARTSLVEPQTGMLVSSFDLGGYVCDGPEGSTIWMVAHCLQLIDDDFATQQYSLARGELKRSILGFGYAREWPESRVGPLDVDSGAIVPGLGASPSSSGLALMAAASFGDRDFYAGLVASLEFAAYPSRRDGALRYCASNQVGDAVIFYSTVVGPLWEKVLSAPKGDEKS
ncbi:MAG: linalool dehydratase/isomerase domain-containing protein [Planctomycetota bacterium]